MAGSGGASSIFIDVSSPIKLNNLLCCVQVLVKAGDKVAVGDPLMVMIAMKMEVRDS